MVDSKSELEIVSRLFVAMEESKDANQFCDHLANSVLNEFNLVASYLAVVESDGRITMVGSWGYPAERRRPEDRPSLWEPMSITDTIRTGEVQVYKNWAAYIDKYPHLEHRAAPGKSFVCIPFSSNGKRSGGLGLTFAEELTGVLDQKRLWEVIAQAGGVFVSKSWATGVFSSKKFSDPLDEAEIRSSLNLRDIEIIRLTVKGKTISQIAKQLQFSESTIKQSRMAIYKKLGVLRAADLKHAALALGIDLD
jgi:DNA-binding CsgD family transcriptional regulator